MRIACTIASWLPKRPTGRTERPEGTVWSDDRGCESKLPYLRSSILMAPPG